MRGIILAGGTGSRLFPLTLSISKQLLPVYDKPLFFYPLSLLMAASIRDITIITRPSDINQFKNFFGNGDCLGISLKYLVQDNPRGLPEAFLIARDQIKNEDCTLVLGDNLFYGSQIGAIIRRNITRSGAKIYGYQVQDVSNYGSFEIDSNEQIINIVEKPIDKKRGLAIPGIYHFDHTVADRSAALKPSTRGEPEIVDLLNSYLLESKLEYSILDRGTSWLDTGTIENLNLASELVRVVQTRQGMLIGSPEEVAYRMGWITSTQLSQIASNYAYSDYGKALRDLIFEL